MQLKEVCQPMPESDDGRTEMTYVRSSTVHDDTQRKKKHDSKVDDRTLLWEKKLFFFHKAQKKKNIYSAPCDSLSDALLSCQSHPPVLVRVYLSFFFSPSFNFLFTSRLFPLLPHFLFFSNLPRHTRQIKKRSCNSFLHLLCIAAVVEGRGC